MIIDIFFKTLTWTPCIHLAIMRYYFFASDKLQNPSQVIAIPQADFYNKKQNKMYSVFGVIVIVKSANL